MNLMVVRTSASAAIAIIFVAGVLIGTAGFLVQKGNAVEESFSAGR